MNKFKSIVREFIPPLIIKGLKATKSKNKETNNINGWHGNYDSWNEAKLKCRGYDDILILETVKNSLLKVKNGEAIYERDSVLFYEKEYAWPLVAILLKISFENNGHLNLIDFGGSLGSSYFQNKSFLGDLKSLRWNIVEQAQFVEKGKELFENEELKFYPTIEESISCSKSNIIILSSVLQYLQTPYEFIEYLVNLDLEYIVLDRTLFTKTDQDILSVQKVPEQIYAASYPCWLFNEKQLLNPFREKYSLIVTFDSKVDRCNYPDSYFKGFFLKKNA